MRMGKALAMPLMAIILGVSMMVGAVSVMRLSNVVENTNTVELPITVSVSPTTLTPDGDLPDYQAGTLLPGVTYDMRIAYLTLSALGSAAIIVEFEKVGISSTDVTMMWRDGTAAWVGMVWVDSGDTIKGTLGFIGTQPANEVVGYYAKLTYNLPGEYAFRVWVEGLVA